MTGFGQTGPYRERAGYDYAIQGMGGLMSITGERDDLGGGPQKVGVAVADLFTGMYATVAILAALRHAEHTGVGQHVDMALLDAQVAMLANLGANYLVSGNVPGRAGNAHQNIVPYQVFEVAPAADGHKDHMILAVGNDGQYAKFCEVARRPELASDPRFARNQDRVRNRAVLVPILETIMKARTKAQWLSALEAAKVPCGAINSIAEVFADPQVNERGMVTQWSHPLQPALRLVSSPIRLSETPVRTDRPPPLLGQHTDEVLRELLGCDDERTGETEGRQGDLNGRFRPGSRRMARRLVLARRGAGAGPRGASRACGHAHRRGRAGAPDVAGHHAGDAHRRRAQRDRSGGTRRTWCSRCTPTRG